MTIELARPTDFRMAFEPRDQTEARTLAKVAVESRFFQVKSEAEALIIMMVGRELGLTAMQALRGIYIVQGRPVVSSDTIVAAVMMSGLADYWKPIESSPVVCTIETKRKGAMAPVSQTWTIEDAKRAGLASKEVWRSYPQDMLRHRCAATLGRTVYPDVLLGCYVQGEIESEGEFIQTQTASVPSIASVSEPRCPQYVLDDIAQFDDGELTLEQAAAIYDTHRSELQKDVSDNDEAFKALHRAMRRINPDASKASLIAAVQTKPVPASQGKNVDEPAALSADQFIEWVFKATSIAELKDIGKEAETALAKGSAERKRFVSVYKQRLAELERRPPPSPPSGGAPKPETSVSDDAEAAAVHAEASGMAPAATVTNDVPTPTMALRAKLAECTELHHLFNAFFKHAPGLGLELDETKRIAADRIIELGRDPMTALNMVTAEICQRGWKTSRKAA